MSDDFELGDLIEERLGNGYWRLSVQVSSAAAIGVAVIRDLLSYADKVENEAADGHQYAEEIRRRIAVHMGVEVNTETEEES